MVHQLALLATCWWNAGRTGSGWSINPARIRSASGREARRLKIGEPQRPQNTRSLPGDDLKCRSKSSPLSGVKASALTGRAVANAVPCALRQCAQWHSCSGYSAPEIENLMPPHKQLPVTIALPLDSETVQG